MDRIESMKIFRDISYSLSLTKTAANMNLSRSYVTRCVNELEQWLDTKLLQRTTRSIYLTRDGEQFLSHCHHIIDYIDKIQIQQQEKNKNITGTITITGSIAFSQRFLSPIIARVNEQYPQLIVNLIADDAIRDLSDDRIDLAIRVTNSPDENLVGRELCRFPSLLVTTPNYLLRNGNIRHPKELTAHRCICYAGQQQLKWSFRQDENEISIIPPIAFKSNESGTLLSYTLAEGGVAILPGFLVSDYIKTGQLVNILPDWEIASLSVYALYLSGRKTHPAIKTLSDFIASEMNN